MKDLECSEDDFKQYFKAEQEYLSNLEKPDPVVEMKKDYVKAIRQLAGYWYVFRAGFMRLLLTPLGKIGTMLVNS